MDMVVYMWNFLVSKALTRIVVHYLFPVTTLGRKHRSWHPGFLDEDNRLQKV